MKNYKMVLAYDGTRYNGWQKQGNTENTIQEKLERILQEISGAETEVFGSGRTDAGTHATGQVMNFHINWNGTAEPLLDAFNAKLPEDIAALSVAEMPPRFHSRLSAKAKHYSYSIWIGKHSPVFERKYTFRCTEMLDVQAMRQAAAAFIGTHDFKSFCANKRMKKSTVRTIYDIVFEVTAFSTRWCASLRERSSRLARGGKTQMKQSRFYWQKAESRQALRHPAADFFCARYFMRIGKAAAKHDSCI